ALGAVRGAASAGALGPLAGRLLVAGGREVDGPTTEGRAQVGTRVLAAAPLGPRPSAQSTMSCCRRRSDTAVHPLPLARSQCFGVEGVRRDPWPLERWLGANASASKAFDATGGHSNAGSETTRCVRDGAGRIFVSRTSAASQRVIEERLMTSDGALRPSPPAEDHRCSGRVTHRILMLPPLLPRMRVRPASPPPDRARRSGCRQPSDRWRRAVPPPVA